MKKFIFLLLVLMAGIGMVSALSDSIHPPGAPAPEVLSGYGVYEAAVTPDTVLPAAPLSIEQPGQVIAILAIIFNSRMPQDRISITAFNTGQSPGIGPPRCVDFPLLC
jgi:hypothetical protein